MSQQIAPGARVLIRDEEWRVKRKDQSNDGGFALRCEGLSGLVRGKEAIFLTELDHQIRVLNPEDTDLIADDSAQYQATKLYLDTLLRQYVPSDNKIYVGQHAAMDQIPYQLDPARQALSQPRQRILIADSVGLGKTLSAGILTAELIARGRGKRILVLATKAMLGQFQQEFFNRFTIPLVRLDSVGLQRVRNQLPSNHNPFHYYDRSIISIDTLKQDAQYRHYLEKAYWDIIIIDEAHNVAERKSRSQRARLAQLLAKRSDTLIMLSATPHDGSPESFASLVNMLDPTAIVDASNYKDEDFRDQKLVIRRFKKHVADQLSKNFPERDIQTVKVPASPAENDLYAALETATFHTLNGRGKGQLFRTTLEKILLSSPAAFIHTLDNRKKRVLKTPERQGAQEDLAQIQNLKTLAKAITPAHFSKFQCLVEMLSAGGPHSEGWDPNVPDDRLVIFTESVQTLHFLEENLPKALKLKKDQTQILHGGMKDREISDAVDNFNRKDASVRLLICSDVASEGINFHHLSHRMIHFDIPWSLMLFQQRNGRIDRYGQHQQPIIRYLTVDTPVAKFKGDTRVLEILIQKDEQAQQNIGDPSEFQGGDSIEEQEAQTAEYIEEGDAGIMSFEDFLAQNQENRADTLEQFTPLHQTTNHWDDLVGELPRIFPSDDAYMRAALTWLSSGQNRVIKDYEEKGDLLSFSMPSDLRVRLAYLPPEVQPKNNKYRLSANKERIFEEMKYARNTADGWAETQFLWPLHPAYEWVKDRALNAFGRHAAPVMERLRDVPAGHSWFLLHGGYPNLRGQFIFQDWLAVEFDGGGAPIQSLPIQEFLRQFPMQQLVNRGTSQEDLPLHQLAPLRSKAVHTMRQHLDTQRRAFLDRDDANIDARFAALDALKQRHMQALQTKVQRKLPTQQEKALQQGEREIEAIFNDYFLWLENTQRPDATPFIQLVAVIIGDTP